MPPDVPATVKANVPAPVTGEPPTEITPPVNVWPTLVTVPAPATVAQVPSPRRNVPEFGVPVTGFAPSCETDVIT